MQADAEGLAPIGGQLGVALEHAALQFDGRAHRLDGAAELDHHAVADRLDDAAMETLDDRPHQFGEMRTQIDERLLLVGAHQAAVAVDVGEQDRREPTIRAGYWASCGRAPRLSGRREPASCCGSAPSSSRCRARGRKYRAGRARPWRSGRSPRLAARLDDRLIGMIVASTWTVSQGTPAALALAEASAKMLAPRAPRRAGDTGSATAASWT